MLVASSPVSLHEAFHCVRGSRGHGSRLPGLSVSSPCFVPRACLVPHTGERFDVTPGCRRRTSGTHCGTTDRRAVERQNARSGTVRVGGGSIKQPRTRQEVVSECTVWSQDSAQWGNPNVRFWGEYISVGLAAVHVEVAAVIVAMRLGNGDGDRSLAVDVELRQGRTGDGCRGRVLVARLPCDKRF